MRHTPLNIKNNSRCQPYPWHPSVVYSENGWNEHKFWMAQTPFPPINIAPYPDRFELPCIHYSDDGVNWIPILTNPIIDLTEEEIEAHNYYSDPHLILRNGVLELFFRFTFLENKQLIGNKTLLMKMFSEDGTHWSNAKIVADLREPKDIAIWGGQIISQSLIWRGGMYYCYYVDRSSYLTNRKICLTVSNDGLLWDKYVRIELQGKYVDPWHIDVQYYDEKYQMVVYDFNNLYWFDSVDGVCFRYVSKIISPTRFFMDFYGMGLYRACSIKVLDDIYVYFSAKNETKTSIGLLKTRDRHSFMPINGMSQAKYFCNYIIPQLSKTNIKRYVKWYMKKWSLTR